MQKKKKILIVDDDRDFADCIKIMLEADGYDVECASSARECMPAVEKRTPDLIILDIMMEKLVSGLQVGYELRSNPAFKDIPIVMVSAIFQETGFDVGGNKGSDYVAADAFLDKPIKPEELLACVRRLLGENAASRQSE